MAKYFYSHRDYLLKNWSKITTKKCKKFLLLVENVAAFTLTEKMLLVKSKRPYQQDP